MTSIQIARAKEKNGIQMEVPLCMLIRCNLKEHIGIMWRLFDPLFTL